MNDDTLARRRIGATLHDLPAGDMACICGEPNCAERPVQPLTWKQMLAAFAVGGALFGFGVGLIMAVGA